MNDSRFYILLSLLILSLPYPAHSDEDSNWPSTCEAKCPNGITVNCDAETKCPKNSVACAANCKMHLSLYACSLSHFQDGEVLDGPSFRNRSQCQKDPKDIPGGLSNNYIDTCCMLRHEYAHLCDTTIRPPDTNSCGEKYAEEFEHTCTSATINYMCEPDLLGRIRGNPEQCSNFCRQESYRNIYKIWDNCMCGVVSSLHQPRGPEDNPSIGSCCGCESQSIDLARVKSLLPSYCQTNWDKFSWTKDYNCKLANDAKKIARNGAHNCPFYDGPEMKPNSCMNVPNETPFIEPALFCIKSPAAKKQVTWNPAAGADDYQVTGSCQPNLTSSSPNWTFDNTRTGLTQCNDECAFKVQAECVGANTHKKYPLVDQGYGTMRLDGLANLSCGEAKNSLVCGQGSGGGGQNDGGIKKGGGGRQR